jgi:hypothetical protein
MKSAKPLTSVSKTMSQHLHTKHHLGFVLFIFTVKCEPPSLQENVVINGYISPALENTQISVSCLPDYGLPHGLREVISTCTSEAVWSPDLLQDLECRSRLIIDHKAMGDCGQLFSVSGVYRILELNGTNNTMASYSEGSLVEFQCVHTPYQIDPLFTTECQAGQWNPHPRDICGQSATVVESGYTFMIITLRIL